MGTRPYPAQNPPMRQGRVAILATQPNPWAGFCFATGKNCLKWQFQPILGHFVTGFFRVGFLVGNPTRPRVAKWTGCQSQNPALPGPLRSLEVYIQNLLPAKPYIYASFLAITYPNYYFLPYH